jgi:PAS domain S-box-containing protein
LFPPMSSCGSCANAAPLRLDEACQPSDKGMEMEHTADEIKNLKACINDLISVLALPAIWTGREPSQILSTLLDVLLGMLRLDFAYARVSNSIGAAPIEVIRLAHPRNSTAQPQKIGQMLNPWLTGDPSASPSTMPNPIGEGEVSIASLRLGLQDEVEVLVAASQRVDFPTETERLLLQVAANQAAIGVQEARLMSEHRRVAEELDQRVAQRTRQLTAVNEELRKENIERKRAEEALRESEERWRAVFENSAAGIALVNSSGRFLAANFAYQKMLGYSEEELGKLSFLDITHEDYRDANSELTTALWEGKRQYFEMEKRYRRKDGNLIWVRVHVSLVSGTQSIPRFSLAIAEDITVRKRAEEELRRSEAYLAEAQRLSHTGSWAWNVSTGEVFWSRELFRIFGLDPAKTALNIDFIRKLRHPEDQPFVEQMFDASVREKRDFEMESRIVLPDGSLRHVHTVGRPVVDDSNNLIEFVGSVMDVTERKQAEEKLRKAQVELAHVTRVMTMGELTTSIAHEVNQPLAAIVTNSNACMRWLAGDSPNLDEAREAARRIIRDGNRASEVITRIRALSKKTGTEKERLDLNEAIQEVVTLTQGEVRRNGVALRTELAGDLPPVPGDRVELQQVVLNLIMNGIEAMSGVGNRARELVIRTQSGEADQVRVIVQDSGIGLDPLSTERIFDAFYTTKPQGMGMGLAISRSIVENHGGRLWAVPNDGPGATFQFTLEVGIEEERRW